MARRKKAQPVVEAPATEQEVITGEENVLLGTDAEPEVAPVAEPVAEAEPEVAPVAEAEEYDVTPSLLDPKAGINQPSEIESQPAASFADLEQAKVAATKPLDNTVNLIGLQLDRYTDIMGVGVIHSSIVGAKAQAILYRAIMQTLMQDGPTFYTAMDNLCRFITTHRSGMFKETRAFRYLDSPELSLTSLELKNFTRLLHALLTLADPAGRQLAIKQVDLTLVMAGISNQEIHQRVIEYFTA